VLSHIVENPPIDLDATNSSFLRWFRVPSHQLGDDARSWLWDLVMRGIGAGVPRSAAPALGPLGAMGLGVSGLYLPGSPGLLPLPINWR
jgi:hypothetical protein